MMDKRDLALQSTMPTVVVPRFGNFQELREPGDRILIAANGVFLESSRRWGYFVRQVGSLGPVVVPYGTCQPVTRLIAAKLPIELLKAFNDFAVATPDVEVGGSIIWNEVTDKYRLAMSKSLQANGSFLRQELASLGPDEHLVIDCHSHAHHGAYFSSEDDNDDKGSTKFAYVVGHCDQESQSTALRLCLKGVFEPIDFKKALETNQQHAKES